MLGGKTSSWETAPDNGSFAPYFIHYNLKKEAFVGYMKSIVDGFRRQQSGRGWEGMFLGFNEK